MRTGIGYDAHAFDKGCDLILGGEKIEYHLGLKGHSDADVLIHAVMDALLGALGKGDIGQLFPDNDEKYKNISSILLLERVRGLLEDEGYIINNLDTTIIAQEPKLLYYKDKMKKNICRALNLQSGQVNIKATTTEGMGFEGRKEGISAFAAIIISRVMV